MKVLKVKAATLPGRVEAKVRVKRGGHPLAGARVSFAGAGAKTSKRGIAIVSTRLDLPGRYKALARQSGRYGLSDLVKVGIKP